MVEIADVEKIRIIRNENGQFKWKMCAIIKDWNDKSEYYLRLRCEFDDKAIEEVAEKSANDMMKLLIIAKKSSKEEAKKVAIKKLNETLSLITKKLQKKPIHVEIRYEDDYTSLIRFKVAKIHTPHT